MQKAACYTLKTDAMDEGSLGFILKLIDNERSSPTPYKFLLSFTTF